jgi:predicted Zn-dependent peptidase
VLAALDALQQPMDKASFEAAREAFLYHVAADTQTPQERADNLGWYTVEGNLQYAPGIADGNYERTARELDPQYVADIVRRYLHNPVVVDLTAASSSEKESP